MEVSVSVLLSIPILLTTCWLYTAHLSRTSFPQFRNKSICLLIAHPDDEAMFFAPTLLALTEPTLGNHVKILCLSTGDADGLGPTRQKELLASASILGLRDSSSDVFVIDSPAFPDSMSQSWSASDISSVLSSAFIPQAASSSSKSKTVSSSSAAKKANGIVSKRKNYGDKGEAPQTTIDVLVTFDRYGVSGHTNHVSLYHGAKAWLGGLMAGKDGWGCPVDLYTLSSTNMARKYSAILDAPVTLVWGVLRDVLSGMGSKKVGKKSKGPRRLFFVNDIMQWRTGQQAMTQGHKSQMRWFRWGWIGIGRYMVVNDLKREKII